MLKGTEKQVALAEKRLARMEKKVNEQIAEWQERIDKLEKRDTTMNSIGKRKQQVAALRKAFEDFKANETNAGHIIHCSDFGIIGILEHEGYLEKGIC